MKTPVFPLGRSFYDETTILHNKILQQATDLFTELSPTGVLRAHREETSPEGIHHVAELPFPASFPWSFCSLCC